MDFITALIHELQQEAAVTRKHLELVDFKHSAYKPHEKSEEFGRLAIHVAELLAWWKSALENEEMNFIDFEPAKIATTPALLAYFDTLLEEAVAALKNANLSYLETNWTMKYGDQVLFTLNRKEVLRKFCMNHFIHHRAQLGVYLRLLDIDVPAGYGPSADALKNFILIKPFQ